MRHTRFGTPSVAIVIAALIALLVIPGSAFAQEAEPVESAESMASAEPAEEAASPKTARVRFLHGSLHGPIDAYVGGELMLEELEFGQISDYMDVPAGEQLLEVVGQGMRLDEARGMYGTGVFPNIAEATQKLKAGATYTAVVNLSDASGTEFLILKDKPKPAAGKAMVRVVGGICEACGQLDYAVEGSRKMLAENLHYDDDRYAGKYLKMKPGELDVILRVHGNKKPAADFEPVVLEPGTSNSLYVVGRLDNRTVTLVPAVDAALSSARFMNASRVPPVLDVYVDGKKVAKRLGPGQAAPKASNLLSGNHLVQVVEVGKKPVDGTLAEATMSFPAGAVAVEVGAGESIEAVSAPTGVVAKAKTPQIRFAHVDPEIPAVNIEIEGLDPVEGLAVGEWTDYLTLPGDSSYLWIRPADDPNGIYHEMPLDLGPGNYTAYLGGSAAIPTVEFVIVKDKAARKKD